MSRNDERSELSAEERDFVAKLREGYQPEPLSGARATAFHARLEERFESSRPSRSWFPAGVLAASAAALALALLVSPDHDPVTTLPGVVPGAPVVASVEQPAPEVPALATGATQGGALMEYALLDDDTDEDSGWLPEDYAVLGGLLEDDTEDLDAES